LASRACALTLGATDEVPPLVVALSPSLSPKLTETHVDTAVINGVQWRSRLALAVALSHFLSWRSNWTCWGLVTMLTYRAMRWKLFGPEPTRPRSPYHRAFPYRSPIALLMVSERSSVDSMGASFLSFSVYIYIYIYFYSFPVGRDIRINEC
jgi:hypothetical protein